MTDDEKVVWAAFEAGTDEIRMARSSIGAPGVQGLLRRGYLVEVAHDFGDHIAVFSLSEAGRDFLGRAAWKPRDNPRDGHCRPLDH